MHGFGLRIHPDPIQGNLLSANLVHMKLMVQNSDGGFVLPCAYTLVD